jgi:hypothetical protein
VLLFLCFEYISQPYSHLNETIADPLFCLRLWGEGGCIRREKRAKRAGFARQVAQEKGEFPWRKGFWWRSVCG